MKNRSKGSFAKKSKRNINIVIENKLRSGGN